MIAALRGYLYAIGAGAALFFGAMLYRKGASDTKTNIRLDDYENAEDIRSRVNDRTDDRLRKFDDAGWRD